MFKKFIVNKDYHNTRFDKWFKHNVQDVPQSLIEKLIRKKKVKINKKKVKTSYRVQSNDIIELYGIDNLKLKPKSKNNKYKPSEKEKDKYDTDHSLLLKFSLTVSTILILLYFIFPSQLIEVVSRINII